MTPDFMKSHLCWMGESYRLYLRNTSILQQKHVDALGKESDKVMQLLGNNRDILQNIIPVDDKMGEYQFTFYFILFFFFFLHACVT
jgi:hypothetical protein